MRIGIDASRLRGHMTGVGRYTAGLLAPLDAAMPDATFTLFARQRCDVPLPSARWVVRTDRHALWSRTPTTMWIHYRLGQLAARTAMDVFWAPNTLLPRGLHVRVPCVVTVYDFLHDIMPQDLPPLTRLAYRMWMDADTLDAARTVAISDGTAKRMNELLGRWPDGIARPLVPEMQAPQTRRDAMQILESHGVREPFVLSVGSYSDRKNLKSVIGGVEILKRAGELQRHQLVLVGPLSWNGRVRGLRNSASNDWVRPLGFVDDSTLAALYSLADAFVFASLYEGFGMPVAEARALGCRVVTTDSPELREAGGADATYVPPTAEGVAAGITLALARPKPSLRHVHCGTHHGATALAEALRAAAWHESTAA